MRFTRIALLVALAGCGGLNDADKITWVRTLGPLGGELISEDGRFVLTIPEGALDREVTITLEESPFDHPQVVGKLYTIDPPIALRGPAAARLTFEDPPDGYVNAPGFFRFLQGEGGNRWDPVSSVLDDGMLVSPLEELGAFCAWVTCGSAYECETGYVCDAGACVADASCGAAEICNDGVDNDCRGGIDNGCAECVRDNDCADNEVCAGDVCECASDVEICGNGVNDDCDQFVDDALDDDCSEQCPEEKQCGELCCTAAEYCGGTPPRYECVPLP